MSKHNEILKRSITEPVYLLNTFENIAMRTEPGNKYFAKPKGLDEYEVKSSTDIVMETMFEANEITKAQYDKY